MLRFDSLLPLWGTANWPETQATTVLQTASPLTAGCELVRKVTGNEQEGEQVFALSSASRIRSRINDVDPSNHGGVGKNRGRLEAPAFSFSENHGESRCAPGEYNFHEWVQTS